MVTRLPCYPPKGGDRGVTGGGGGVDNRKGGKRRGKGKKKKKKKKNGEERQKVTPKTNAFHSVLKPRSDVLVVSVKFELVTKL